MKLEVSRLIFEKYSNIKYHENPSSGSRVVPCGRTDGWTDMTKLIGTFRIFVNAPKNGQRTHSTQPSRTHTAIRSRTADKQQDTTTEILTDRQTRPTEDSTWIDKRYILTITQVSIETRLLLKNY